MINFTYKYNDKDFNFKFKDNISLVFGKSNSGKTTMINQIARDLKSSRNIVYEDNSKPSKDVFIIPDYIEIKKELKIGKTTLIKKILSYILSDIIDTIDSDLIDNINESNLIKEINNNLEKYQTTNTGIPNKFKFLIDSKIIDVDSLIENLLNVKIVDNNTSNIIDDKMSMSISKELYMELISLIPKKENSIYILDCIDSSYSELEYNEIYDIIINLSNKSPIIIFTRSISYLSKWHNFIEVIQFLDNSYTFNNIKNNLVIFTASINYNKKINLSFNEYLNQLRQVIDDKDLNKASEYLKISLYYIIKLLYTKDYMKIIKKSLNDKIIFMIFLFTRDLAKVDVDENNYILNLNS